LAVTLKIKIRESGAMRSGAEEKSRCWICGGENMGMVKPSNIEILTSESFSITDSHYGMTGAIYRCSNCRFLQCSELSGVLRYYENLVDSAYDAGHTERSIQARKILELVRKLQPGGRLLDIGAGSGFLVEQAIQMGYQAEGIEPSGWLRKMAAQRGLPVHLGTFPHPTVSGQFDVITLIDVVEHVSEPVELLQHIADGLTPDGTAIVVTPDVDSIAARVLGWKWWHYRVAHIGYFNKQTLFLALDKAGLQPILARRPAWYFTAEYVWERTHRYLPDFLRMAPPRFVARRIIPVNPRDSWLVACRRRNSGQEPTTSHPA
jgi:SAM-dependent methyltransferase